MHHPAIHFCPYRFDCIAAKDRRMGGRRAAEFPSPARNTRADRWGAMPHFGGWQMRVQIEKEQRPCRLGGDVAHRRRQARRPMAGAGTSIRSRPGDRQRRPPVPVGFYRVTWTCREANGRGAAISPPRGSMGILPFPRFIITRVLVQEILLMEKMRGPKNY